MMADKATEMWERIYRNAIHDSVITQVQSLLLDSTYSLIQSIQPVLQAPLEPIFKQLAEAISTYRRLQNSYVYTPTRIDSVCFDATQDWTQFWQSAAIVAEELEDILDEKGWYPSDDLTDSINCTIQEVVSFQKETNVEVPLEIPTDKPLTKDYIKQNIWSILGLLLGFIQILFFFMPNQDLQAIIEQNQQIIEQNDKQLQLARERNKLLQQLCDTVQAIDDETGILGEQLEPLVEQDNDLIQTANSPSSDDAADSEQQ